VLLIRHSAPEIDPARPAEEWPLSEEGRRRCAPLAERVALYRPDRLLSSPEPKALETAALIAPMLGLDVEVDDALRETARRTVGWLDREAFRAGIRALFARPDDVVFGEESAAAALARFAEAVEALEGRPAVVTHGTVMSLYVGRSHPDRGFAFWERLGLPAAVEI
jgi:broad specificity phosphatase PhoE